MESTQGTKAVSFVAGALIMPACNEDKEPWSPVDISIDAGHILSLTPHKSSNNTSGETGHQSSADTGDTTVFDATGLYAIPGLINAHAHLFSYGDIANPDIVTHAADYEHACHDGSGPFESLAQRCALTELATGVTTLRCMGDFFEADIRLRDAICSGTLQGPNILCCGRPLTVAKGHGDGPIARKAVTPAEFETCTQASILTRPNFLKIFATGGVVDAKRKGEPGELKMTAEQIAAVCKTAHAQGLQVSAHAESTLGVEVCLQAGVDFIEHGAALSEQCIELFKQTGAVLVQTLSPALGLARFADAAHLDQTVQYNAGFMLEQMLEGLQQARSAHIPIALGNDASCAFVPHYSFWRELAHTSRLCGLSTGDVIRAATTQNAEVLHLDDCGRLVPGARADIVFYRDNPLEDLRALAHPQAVLCKGAFASLDYETIPSIDEQLDKIV